MALSVVNLSNYPALGTSVDSAGTGLSNPTWAVTSSAPTYTPNGTVYIAGFLDDEMRAKQFYVNNTSGSVIALPTLISITAVYDPTAASIGQFIVRVQPAAGSPDVLSVQTFRLDPNAMLLVASTSVG